MIENNPTNVSAAFETLLEEIEAEIDFGNGVGARAFEIRDYDKAREALERSGTLTAFRDRIAALRKEWQSLAATAEQSEDEQTRADRRNLGKLRKGIRTPESAFHRPILTVLDKMGGGGKTAEVLEQVRRLMEPVLQEVDYDGLSSGPDNPRWRNTAQWARHSMIGEGLLKGDSARGVWEITDLGRERLNQR